jgi:Zn-dependent M28 family amino/carboxypeptidase
MDGWTRAAVAGFLLAVGPARAGGLEVAGGAPSLAEQAAAGRIEAAPLRAHVKFLASDLLEGRLPGSRGDRLAQAYIAARLEALGLEPAAPGGGYLQRVPLVGVDSRMEQPLRLTGRRGALELSTPGDLMLVAGDARPRSAWAEAELVFVGHGISSPEHGWDDFKGADLRGKVLLVMNGNPPLDPATPEARLYVGRWTYKFEEAARRGAAGVILVHTTRSASYPWQVVRTSWSGAQFRLPDDGAGHLEIEGWATEEACRRLVALGGQDLERLRAAAARRDFRPVPLGVKASLVVSATVTRAETANVLARLPGGDPRRAGEAVLYTAHHDHLGRRPGAAPGDDDIFNGAVDNATGVAAVLEVAAAFAALPRPPARSILFAAVAAEEQGTIGSRWLARHLPLPAGRLAAVINLDSMNVFGRTRDLVAVGRGRTTLDPLLDAVAGSQGRVVLPDPDPASGGYYRSDHFPLAQVGVPGLFLGGGQDFVGRPAGWGAKTRAAWGQAHYHQPSDEWRDEYDLSGMVEDARLAFFLGARVAEAAALPGWRAGDEFEPVRRAAVDDASR